MVAPVVAFAAATAARNVHCAVGDAHRPVPVASVDELTL